MFLPANGRKAPKQTGPLFFVLCEFFVWFIAETKEEEKFMRKPDSATLISFCEFAWFIAENRVVSIENQA